MFLNPILKGFTLITRLVIGVLMIVVLTISNAAIAAPIFQDGLDIGLTAFYPNPEGQSQKIQALAQIKQPTDNKEQVYTIAVPLSFPPSGLGDGSFQQADLDFTRCATKNDRIRVLDDNLMVLISESLANQDQKTSCTSRRL